MTRRPAIKVKPMLEHRAAHRCMAPSCAEWACFGFGPPIYGLTARITWLCAAHKDLAEEEIKQASTREVAHVP